eukprot:8594560-Lingulodinium_polyedra.AAC.1
MAAPGDVLLLRYAVDGPEIWHERVVLAVSPARPSTKAVLTPDWDHYVEECTLENPDLQGIRASRG